MLEPPRISRSLATALTLLTFVIVGGTAGYVVLEHWSWFDAFYMTVMTITTIGGGEATPLNVPGRWWTILVVAVGFGILTYTLLRLISYTLV